MVTSLRMDPAIFAENVSVQVGRGREGRTLLSHVSLAVPEGTFVSIIGALEADMQESMRALAAGGVDVTLLAEHWARSNLPLRITWLENWITQRVLTYLGGADSNQTAERVRLPAALLKPKIRALFELLDAARDLRRLTSTGMNQQLALEAFAPRRPNRFGEVEAIFWER